MLKQTLKRMALTGATVMVLLSMAVPAVMAAPVGYYQEQPNVSEGSYEVSLPPLYCLLKPADPKCWKPEVSLYY